MEIIKYAFFQKALVACVLSGIACGIIGVWVVVMRISFIGVSISHSAFAGSLLAILIKKPVQLFSFIFTLITSSILGPFSDRTQLHPETSMGIIFSLTLGLSFLFLGLIPESKSEALNYMWGSILTVDILDIYFLFAITIFVFFFDFLFFREIKALLFNRELAKANGFYSTIFFYLILYILGLSITFLLKIVGGLLVYALIVNPASSAYQITYNIKKMFFLSVIFGILSTISGLFISSTLNIPTGASIILFSGLLFVFCFLFSPKRRKNEK
ncbi:MAG TPA: metal ABC transporter permease [bacterium]|nr:metal ABC transporter permease [bacterium]HOM26766.1 metal ABC transporter permease [bacterium]